MKKEKKGWRKILGGDQANLDERNFKIRGIYFKINPKEKTEYFIKAGWLFNTNASCDFII